MKKMSPPPKTPPPTEVKEITYFMKRRHVEAYVVGAANAGKSSFINKLLRSKDKKDVVTTSHLPGTTLDLVRVSVSSRLCTQPCSQPALQTGIVSHSADAFVDPFRGPFSTVSTSIFASKYSIFVAWQFQLLAPFRKNAARI